MPLIARWPGRINAGIVIDELTSSLDWFPTLLKLAGVSVPTDRVIDGVDITDVIFGTGPSKRNTFLYFEWRTARLVAVRIGPWKLHLYTRGSHCTPPFPDPNCYDMDFKVGARDASIATGRGGGGGERDATCHVQLSLLPSYPLAFTRATTLLMDRGATCFVPPAEQHRLRHWSHAGKLGHGPR